MPTVFVCYRRDDTAAYAGWLRQSLVTGLGKQHVFMDIDAIAPGADFDEVIQQTLTRVDVMIVLIGPKWATLQDETGTRRIDDPDDYVRLEVASGLKRKIRVIPVLVGGAQLPKSEQLPDDLKRIVRRQSVELSDGRWDYDTSRLIAAIRETGTIGVSPTASRADSPVAPQPPPEHVTPSKPFDVRSTPEAPRVVSRSQPLAAPTTGPPPESQRPSAVQPATSIIDALLSARIAGMLAIPVSTAMVLMAHAEGLTANNAGYSRRILVYLAAFCIACGLFPVTRGRAESRALSKIVLGVATWAATWNCFFGLYLPWYARNVVIAATCGLALGLAACVWPLPAGRWPLVRWMALAAIGALVWAGCFAFFYSTVRPFVPFDGFRDGFSNSDGQVRWLDWVQAQYLWEQGVKLKTMLGMLGLLMGGSVALARSLRSRQGPSADCFSSR